MDGIKYIRCIKFNKHSDLSDIKYIAKLRIPNINRHVNVMFDYNEKNVENSLYMFADAFKNKREDIIDMLLSYSQNCVKGVMITDDKELLKLFSIKSKDEVFLFLTYHNLILKNDCAILQVRCEWQYVDMLNIVFKDNNIDFQIKNSSLNITTNFVNTEYDSL